MRYYDASSPSIRPSMHIPILEKKAIKYADLIVSRALGNVEEISMVQVQRCSPPTHPLRHLSIRFLGMYVRQARCCKNIQ
ncbi:hypothetical protein VTL71DRAFT_12172 [Oculimacula yallundae]|uniref:Uncharacterized protein n=1 Tax=Oculimacula yallundae TaxID=86028 RepID=A0ABR4CUR9_9HELO